ncbi:MAG TPA: hypothetical protein VE713_11115 [Pyrinomonadaceae bacterium]|nr:hypothetical protein [Pyrinomonadaceae bacterium]
MSDENCAPVVPLKSGAHQGYQNDFAWAMPLCLTSTAGTFQVKAKVKREKAKVRPKAILIKAVSAKLLPLAFLLLPFPSGFCYSLRR